MLLVVCKRLQVCAWQAGWLCAAGHHSCFRQQRCVRAWLENRGAPASIVCEHQKPHIRVDCQNIMRVHNHKSMSVRSICRPGFVTQARPGRCHASMKAGYDSPNDSQYYQSLCPKEARMLGCGVLRNMPITPFRDRNTHITRVCVGNTYVRLVTEAPASHARPVENRSDGDGNTCVASATCP